MSTTLLMSYPGPAWHIRGGENFRSQTRAPASPRGALREWLALCDAITAAGGHILVMPPAVADGQPLTGMVYTANSGALFKQGDQFRFVVSSMAVPHRKAEAQPISAFMREAGIAIEPAGQVWEGQADITTLPGNRFILTWGVRTVKEACAAVRARLPQGARVLEVQLRNPYFHGDTCMNPLTSKGGDTTLLVFGGALVDTSLEQIRQFVGNAAELFPVEEADALGYACNALCVDGTVLLPTGLSTGLRGQLVRRGLQLQELDLGELFGKGGGGPRCLVNELRGLVLSGGAPDYASQRDKLYALAGSYADRYAEQKPGA